MKNKNFMERNNKFDSSELFSRLMDRPLFSGERLVNYISRQSITDARVRVDEVNGCINLDTVQVINSCINKLKSWKIGVDQLDHTMLFVI